ncbi:MAG: hypothetical protein KDI19_12075 [Pseudomonadales bacterium]|nr:hypothetical protein [Pseudomonadales bacterium]
MRKHVKLLLVMSLAWWLAGCDSDDHPRLTPTPQPVPIQQVSIGASLGLIKNADVSIQKPDGTELDGATGTLGADGSVAISFDGTYGGPIVVVVTGNDSATYFDEATGTELAFPAGRTIRAYAPAPQANVGVTILTELAAQIAATLGADATADDITMVNEAIRAAFAPDVDDLLSVPTLVSADNMNQSLAADAAGRYALRLAALAGIATGRQAPALGILDQLTADLSDGALDGMDTNGPIAGLDYTGNDFASAFNAAVQSAAATLAGADLMADAGNVGFGNASNVLQALADGGVPLPDEVIARIGAGSGSGSNDGSGSGGDSSGGSSSGGDGTGSGSSADSICVVGGSASPATIPGSFTTSPYDLTFGSVQPNSPYAEGDMRSFSFAANGDLLIDNVVVASDPVLCGGNGHEALWKDEASGLIYAMSSLLTGFNEVNVGASDGTYYGQFRIPDMSSGPPAELTALAGMYSAVVITSCSGSNCPNTTPVGDSVSVVIGNDGSVMFGDRMLSSEVDGALFQDFTNNSVEPRYELYNPTDTQGESYRALIYVEDGAPVAFGLKHGSPCGGGCVSTKQLYTEIATLPAEVESFFDDLIAATAMPVTMTVVMDDPTYSGATGTQTNTPFGASAMCRSFDITAARDYGSSNDRPRFVVYSSLGNILDYRRRTSRYRLDTVSGDQTLSYNGGQFTLRGDNYIDFEEGFLGTDTLFVSTVRDRATSDPAEIATACADYHRVEGQVNVDTGAAVVTIGLKDTVSGTTLDTRSDQVQSGTPFDFSFVAAKDLQFEVVIVGKSPSSVTCTVMNGTGTVGDTDVNNVMVNCVQ